MTRRRGHATRAFRHAMTADIFAPLDSDARSPSLHQALEVDLVLLTEASSSTVDVRLLARLRAPGEVGSSGGSVS